MKKLVYLYREFTSFEGSLFKYSLAFSLLLALAPSVLIVALLFKYAYLSEDILLNFILHFIPDNNTEMIDQIFSFFTDKDYNITSFIITMCVSFYLASKSIFSFLLISASHEHVEVPKWSIRIKSVIIFVLMAFLFIACAYIATNFFDFLPFIFSGIMLLVFYFMYRTLSFRKRDWSFGLAGAMFSTIGVLLLATLFVMIVTKFTSYQDVYGPLASFVTLLLAIYLISCIIYFGFCLNLVIEDEYGYEQHLPLKHGRFYDLAIHISHKISKLIERK